MERNIKKVIITGGLGFIGSNLIHYFLQKHPDWKIFNVDKIAYCGREENLAGIEDNPNYKFYKFDICNREAMYWLFGEVKPDVVINLASESHVDKSISDPDAFLMSDVIGAQVVYEAVRKNDVPLIITASTDEIFGNIDKGFADENYPINPSSAYSASKASADILAQAYHTTYDLPVIIVRPSNNYGIRQFPEKLIPRFTINAILDRQLPVYGTGKNVRDWLWVEDNCRAIDLLIHKGKIGEAYNIGADCEKSVLDITNIILDKLDKPESLIKFVKDRPGHDTRYALDWSKIANLGWKPTANFEQELRTTIKWYRDRPDYWKPFINDEFVKP